MFFNPSGSLCWVRIRSSEANPKAFCFVFKIFFMYTIFKVSVECVTILLLFYVLGFLAMRHVGS